MVPWLGEEEAEAAAEAVRSGWVAQGPRVAEFETAFAAEVGAAHGVAVSSGTTALHLGLVALGVGAGDEVVVPSLSFIATANAARYVGATPVFADVDPATGNLTPETVAAALTSSDARRDPRAPGRASRPTWTRCASSARNAASRCWRTRPARPAPAYRGRPVGVGAQVGGVVVPSAQAAHHRRGRHGHHRRRRVRPPGCGGCASTA